MTPLLAALGWILAALALGLWYGERGRRIDAQRREGRIPVGKPKKPQIRKEASAATHDQEEVLQEAKKAHIEACRAEGFSEDEAAEDWERMLAQMNVGGDAPWQANV